MIQTFIDNVVKVDSIICLKVSRLNGRKILDRVMAMISYLGDGYFYGFIILIMLLLNFELGKKITAIAVIAFSLETLLHAVLKQKTKRNRPFEKVQGIQRLINPPDKFSFPSGHTGAAFVMANLMSFFFPVLLIPMYLFAILVGFSRIYNGLHFPSDVLAGSILGIVCTQIGIAIIL